MTTKARIQKSAAERTSNSARTQHTTSGSSAPPNDRLYEAFELLEAEAEVIEAERRRELEEQRKQMANRD